MQVISTDSSSSRQQLEQLLQQSDVVSMHCPLNEATQVRLLRKCADQNAHWLLSCIGSESAAVGCAI
jgi:hypothetical protein